MKRRFKIALIYVLQPRTIIFLVALFNFVWFFSQSYIVVEFGSNSHTFCYICPWYWDWSLTNLPSLSLMATICLFVAQWKGYLAASIISGYQIIAGINFISDNSGFFSGFSQRLQIISESDAINVWELLDVQYLLALVIFVTALIYLVKYSVVVKQKPIKSYP